MNELLTRRHDKSENTVVDIGSCRVGDGSLIIIAGPCAVESMDQMLYLATLFKKAGVSIIRGGAYKPRTSPYSFQGLGEEGLKILAAARSATGIPFVTEATDSRSLEKACKYADVIQIGSRNMQNFSLLKEAGRSGMPVLLKRGLSSTLEEWIMAAEYIASEGNNRIIFCERGIRTFENYTRNTMDISAIPAIKELSHFPAIADPSHGTGRRSLVGPLAKAAVAAGADGIMLEVHENPPGALSDGPQSLYPKDLEELVPALKALHNVCNIRVKAV
ncbi:MAG: 3-deoxy-7-phosphoheptulonate synthase [Desulfocucumaceae bacterium]